MEFIKNVEGAPKPVGPYSPAVKQDGLLFCSGQIGLDPETGKLVDGGVEGQTAQVLANMKAVLSASGSSIDRILMTSIFLADIQSGAVVNKLYGEFVNQQNPPARQTVAVKDLPLGALVEISVIASAK
jgi:2-iminobutanoate/2-iminopropanoate deaminase